MTSAHPAMPTCRAGQTQSGVYIASYKGVLQLEGAIVTPVGLLELALI